MDYRYITGNSDHAHDCAGVNIDDGDTDHIIDVGHGGVITLVKMVTLAA